MKEFCIIIPAVKKNVAFPDDLVKKLCGIPLIQRAIDKAKNIAEHSDIFLVTDSEEITLICERNGINCFYKRDLKFKSLDIIKELKFFLLKIYKSYKNIIIFWAYTPLLSANEILKAYNKFVVKKIDVLITLKEEKHRLYKEKGRSLQNLIFDEQKEKFFIESKSFLILKSSLITITPLQNLKIQPFILNEDELEIRNYQDWWVCEKLLQRKRIVFRVIGHEEVGMGHIYRALSLAHEITDHEVIFVCDERSRLAVNKIAGYDYRIEVAPRNKIVEKIISLKPDLVVNDMLNTTKEYVLKLKRKGMKVLSFEDLGTGARYTDLTINELYDEPRLSGNNIRWGYKYFFVRDEFNDAKPHKFKKEIGTLLIAFGGTDPNDLTFKTLNVVVDFCKSRNIGINVVTGDGYLYKEKLTAWLYELDYKGIKFTYSTGVISKIMGKSQIAISSNGRTVYELAHMNIPSIIVSHHERENTHLFSKEENGFVNVGVYREGVSEKIIAKSLERLVRDSIYRRRLFDNMKRFNFSTSKPRVVSLILRMLNGK